MTMKIAWSGVVVGVQPRIRLSRSFDQRQHSYQGYVLRVQGEIGAAARAFVVALGKGAQEKHQFRVGDRVSGVGEAIVAPETEIADLYKVAKLEVVERSNATPGSPPPWVGSVAPPLEVYRERGHRRLDAGTFERSCTSCIWGCEMAVEMIIDQWNPGNVRCAWRLPLRRRLQVR